MTRFASLVGCAGIAALAVAGCASSPATGGGASSQVDFGIDMARRGLWNEALFRFEQARRERPADPKVLNNLAVAYEAVGRFDEALALYKEASRVAPGDRGLKLNYSRFLEFYQNYRPKRPDEAAKPQAPAEVKP
ncbi:MAG: tetratricopeptide repeat protein [Thermoanaerobaculia bacterium]|nr:tetratricopeptide repeat protein [Thermoanaerobaculia bacterium]